MATKIGWCETHAWMCMNPGAWTAPRKSRLAFWHHERKPPELLGALQLQVLVMLCVVLSCVAAVSFLQPSTNLGKRESQLVHRKPARREVLLLWRAPLVLMMHTDYTRDLTRVKYSSSIMMFHPVVPFYVTDWTRDTAGVSFNFFIRASMTLL